MQSTWWWVWLLLGNGAWIFQRVVSGLSDENERENELALLRGAVRSVLIMAMIFCFATSVILFVKWARTF